MLIELDRLHGPGNCPKTFVQHEAYYFQRDRAANSHHAGFLFWTTCCNAPKGRIPNGEILALRGRPYWWMGYTIKKCPIGNPLRHLPGEMSGVHRAWYQWWGHFLLSRGRFGTKLSGGHCLSTLHGGEWWSQQSWGGQFAWETWKGPLSPGQLEVDVFVAGPPSSVSYEMGVCGWWSLRFHVSFEMTWFQLGETRPNLAQMFYLH